MPINLYCNNPSLTTSILKCSKLYVYVCTYAYVPLCMCTVLERFQTGQKQKAGREEDCSFKVPSRENACLGMLLF